MSSIKAKVAYNLCKKFTVNRVKAKAFIACLPKEIVKDDNPEYSSISKRLMDREYKMMAQETGLPERYLRSSKDWK